MMILMCVTKCRVAFYGCPVDTLRQRAEVVAITMPSNPVDTDGNFEFTVTADFMQELCEQAKIGIPTIYNAEYVYQHRTFALLACRKLSPADFARIRQIMSDYIAGLKQ